jgi:hypothetical protein
MRRSIDYLRCKCQWMLACMLPATLASAAWGAPGSVECRLICGDNKECKTSDQSSPTKGPWKLEDCELDSRKVELGWVEVWYLSKHTPQMARVGKDERIASALKFPDFNCGVLNLACLWPSPPKPVSGAHPIGDDDESSHSSGAKAGLPFGTILQPVRELKLSTMSAAADSPGVFSLWEAGSQRLVTKVPIADGVAALASTVIKPESDYRYRWQAGSLVLEGNFSTSALSARADLEQVDTSAMSAEQRQWRVLQALSRQGYDWDAIQAALSLQKLQGARP